MKKTVVFDFDGVIHSYKSGWKGATVISDPPVKGIRAALREIHEAGYEVVAVSTRCATEEGRKAIQKWLHDNILDRHIDKICKEKPPAVVYIDDRAICFDGNTADLLDKIENFQPWTEEGRKEQVNHPAHYNIHGRKECIEEMIDKYGPERTADWCEMTAFKYDYRAGEKEGNPEEQDKAKEDWYLDKAAEIRLKYGLTEAEVQTMAKEDEQAKIADVKSFEKEDKENKDMLDIRTDEQFLSKAIDEVANYTDEHLDKSDAQPEYKVFVVWYCKTLQNFKALLSTSLFDGMYYEVTYNGDKGEMYLDAYKKFENRCITE